MKTEINNECVQDEGKVLFDITRKKEDDYLLSGTQKESQLLLSLLKSKRIVEDQIKSYEYFIENRIPEILKQRVINLEDGTHVAFTNPHHALPSLSGKNGHPLPLFPQEARERQMTYALTLMIDLERRYHEGSQVTVDGKPQVIRNVEIGKIPVMLGSKYDNLEVYNIKGHDLLKQGECPFDPMGYFVVSGQNKVILIQERLRTGRIFIFPNPKGEHICRITCLTVRGSTIVELSHNLKQQCIRLHLQVFSGKRSDITILQAFLLLGFTEIDQIIKFILFFVKPEWQRKVLMQLQGTISTTVRICGQEDIQSANLKDIYNECIYTGAGKGRKKNQNKFTYDSYQQANGFNKDLLSQEVYQLVVGALFPNIDLNQARTQDEYKTMIEDKKIMLAVMTARYAEFLAGLTPKDERDSWTNKCLKTGGQLMEQLFRRLWDISLNDIEDDISGPAKRKTLETVKQKISPSLITDNMESSFVPNQWGAPNSNKDQNVTDFLNREESILSVYDQMLRINTPTNRRAKQAGARGVQLDQGGSVCPVQTPSGEACGLVKNKAIGCWISVQSDDITCRKYLEDHISKNYSLSTPHLCILNARPLGWCQGERLRKIMVDHRRRNEIPFDTALVFDKNQIFYVHTDGSRPTKPYLIVDDDGVPLISKYNAWNMDFESLRTKGFVEYLDIWEAINHANVASSLRKIEKYREDRLRLELMSKNETDKNLLASYETRLRRLNKKVYNYVDIDPNINQGPAANTIVYIDHNQGPRNTFQCGMGIQAIGLNHSNPALQFPTTGRYLAAPSPAIVYTQLYKYFGLDDLPAGVNLILGIITDKCNEEDGVTVKKEFLESGALDYTVIHSYETVVRNLTKISNGEMSEHVLKPKKAFPRHRMEQYRLLDEDGIITKGAVVRAGDCLVGKIRMIKTYRKGTRNNQADQDFEDSSLYVDIWEEGIVDEVLIKKNLNDEIVIKIRIRISRRPIIGDKVATRAAQKSVISRIVPAAEMPQTKDGITPDILINPHALPKRMTISTYLEMVEAKLAALLGTRVDASGFKTKTVDQHKELLEIIYGYDGNGLETLYFYSGGEQRQAVLAIGPHTYQLLKHQVLSKQQARADGPKGLLTRQPPRGRKQGGGVRFGEQEVNGTLSHGAVHFLNDRLLKACDDHTLIVCTKCHMPAVANVTRGIIICKICGGNSFATSRQAYTMSLLGYLSAITGVRMTPIYSPEKKRKTDDLSLDLLDIDSFEEIEYSDQEEEDFEDEGDDGFDDF